VLALAEVIGAAGLLHPEELQLHHLMRRVSSSETKSAADLYPGVPRGSLLNGAAITDPTLARWWPRVGPDSFGPLN
jgi:hypothetical protein